MKDLPEYGDVVDEEDRKAAYEKHIRRLKEKLADTEASSSSRRDSHRMDVDDDRRERRRTRSRERSRDRRPERLERKERRFSPERDERDRKVSAAGAASRANLKRPRHSLDVGKHDDVEEGEI
jgi:pre-mRNA-processing factor 40